MPEEFFVPKLGQTVEEVIMVGWLVEDGEKVSQGQAVMEVETDKAVFPVEANAKGFIHLGPYKAGDVIPVLTVVAVIGKQDDKFEVKGAAPAATGCADPDDGCAWAKSVGHSHGRQVNNVMINSIGRGGVNASLILGR